MNGITDTPFSIPFIIDYRELYQSLSSPCSADIGSQFFHLINTNTPLTRKTGIHPRIPVFLFLKINFSHHFPSLFLPHMAPF